MGADHARAPYGRGEKLIRQADFVIVGGGILGLTCARELLMRHPHARLVVLEKESELGRHASGRNSGVLHSGIYYSPDTLKAQAAAEGAKALADYCDAHDLPNRRMGKLVLAHTEAEEHSLKIYMQRASQLGVRAEWAGKERIHDIEPAAAHQRRSLYLPDVAVIDPKAVLDCLAGEVRAMGGEVRLACAARGVDARQTMLATDTGGLDFGFLINAAGAHVDILARAFGIAERFLLLPFMGRYYRLNPAAGIEVRGLIYPVPDARLPFLGIHFTRSVHGDVYAGPSAVPVLGREHYHLLQGIDWGELPGRLGLLAGLYAKNRQGFRLLAHRELATLSRRHFAAEAARLVPKLKPEHLLPSGKAGIRPQLFDCEKGEMVMDFMVERTDNSLHILNAISPALTCSFAIARRIADQIG